MDAFAKGIKKKKGRTEQQDMSLGSTYSERWKIKEKVNAKSELSGKNKYISQTLGKLW